MSPDDRPNARPPRLQFDAHRSYVAIAYDGLDVGFCAPEFASRVVETFHREEKLQEENERLRQALQQACTDLAQRDGGNAQQAADLMRQYLDRNRQPDRGSQAIAFMLRERQSELDMNDAQFAQFCGSLRLSPAELQGIFAGQEVTDEQLTNLARVLGRPAEELADIRDGFTDSELSRLARILGVSSQELDALFAE